MNYEYDSITPYCFSTVLFVVRVRMQYNNCGTASKILHMCLMSNQNRDSGCDRGTHHSAQLSSALQLFNNNIKMKYKKGTKTKLNVNWLYLTVKMIRSGSHCMNGRHYCSSTLPLLLDYWHALQHRKLPRRNSRLQKFQSEVRKSWIVDFILLFLPY